MYSAFSAQVLCLDVGEKPNFVALRAQKLIEDERRRRAIFAQSMGLHEGPHRRRVVEGKAGAPRWESIRLPPSRGVYVVSSSPPVPVPSH